MTISGSDRAAIIARLKQLAHAVTLGPEAVARECTMRVPAEPLRDADLVLSTAADLLSQPEPEGPTDEEWEALKERAWDRYRTVGYQGELFIYDRDFDTALDDVLQKLAHYAHPTIEPVPVSERLPELRGMFERILCVARSSGGLTVGNIQLAGRLIDAVVSWSGDALPVPGAEVGS